MKAEGTFPEYVEYQCTLMSQLEHSTNVTGWEAEAEQCWQGGRDRHQLDTGQLFQFNLTLMTLMFAPLIWSHVSV